jgi:hypothetical protein
MDHLPFLDEHVERIAAPAERVWTALLTTLREQFSRSLPRPLISAWGLQQSKRLGEWTANVSVGDTLPGFAVTRSDPARLLTLRGGHRFSRYELRFELDSTDPRGVEIHAKTSAEFPGWQGRIYRALVIGTGGHRILVGRFLRTVARRAVRTRAVLEG